MAITVPSGQEAHVDRLRADYCKLVKAVAKLRGQVQKIDARPFVLVVSL